MTAQTGSCVALLSDLDTTHIALAGGKGAHLGELWQIDGVRVPPGFCVTTDAYRRVVTSAPSVSEPLARLSRLDHGDRAAIAVLSAELREAIEALALPDDVAAAITAALARLGAHRACAVRSSATAEDSPTASFAGLHDSYLRVVGPAAVLQHVRRVWASLFTEQAVAYRLRNGVDQRTAEMAVVVQEMVEPHAAGVLFTADPITSNRRITAVEASFGLGEALVSGRVNADVYRVRDGDVIAKTVAAEHEQPALTDAQVVRLAALGRRVEAHFGRPQDIEWCLAQDDFQLVQARPITTLFPIPAAADDASRVYVSVGHQQMMTDPMKPLGLSLFQLTALPPMHEAGGRLFVEVTDRLAAPATRAGLVAALGKSDPLIGDALQTIVARGDFLPPAPDDRAAGPLRGAAPVPIETDPAIVDALIARSQASLAVLHDAIAAKTGPELLDFIRADVQELKALLFDPLSHQVIMAGMEATWSLNEHLETWLGEKNAADTLTQSVPGNVTSEMGLALLDVADAVRPHPDVVAFLQTVAGEPFFDDLDALDGGPQAHAAIRAFLDRYGMRCAGEIDITRPRWSERPSMLLPVLLGNVKNFEHGAGPRRFEAGRREAWAKEQEVLARLRDRPGGEDEAAEVKRLIDRVRVFSGYREYPKYGIVARYLVYKLALLEEADRLVQAGVLNAREDVFMLTFAELEAVARTHELDGALIAERERAFRGYQALTPPRVLTSEGEVVAGEYRREGVPAGALVGLPVSAGTVQGRARVIRDLADADCEPGDILVTTYTDPSWTPLFVGIDGLVTEVGGLMTHGAVIAREYGLPAVVGVPDATRLIRDGQRIRVHGTDGFVELLS